MLVKKLARLLGIGMLASWPLVAGAPSDGLTAGKQLFESGRYEEARKALEPSAKSNSSEAVFYMGRIDFAQGKYDEAIEWFEKATELTPGRSDYFLWLGRSSGNAAQDASVLRKPGLAKQAQAAFTKAVALNPDNLDAREDLVKYYLGAPAFLGGSVDEARVQATEIKKRDFVRGAQALADVHVQEGETAAAEQLLREAVQKAPGDPRGWMALGSLYQKEKKWNAAFDSYEAILKTIPSHFDALYQIGRVGAISGQRLDRAEECLKRYVRHIPSPSSGSAPLSGAHYRLGMVYEKKGNRPMARAEYQMALKLDPNLKEAKEALSKLK